MTDTTDTSRKDNPRITDKQVKQYLAENHGFFVNHPDLLGEIQLPHESGQAISLVERQVSVLRERNKDMRERLSNLLDNARENDRLFDKTKRLVLALLECNDFGDLVDALYYSFDKEFLIPHTRLIVFGNEKTPSSVARIENIKYAKGFLGTRLKASRIVSGGLDARETKFLFDKDAEKIGSSAIAVLSHGNIMGVLAIGNPDPEYYRSSMGTLFLSHIAEVLDRLIPKYLENP